MKLKLKPFVLAALACSTSGQATSIPTDVTNGNVDNRNTIMALTNATVHLNANKTIENATLLIQNDRILNISKGNNPPAKATIKDYSGMHIYPGFINLDSNVGLPAAAKREAFSWGGPETINSTTQGAYNSNEAIKASYDAAEFFTTDSKSNKKMRAQGFTNALSHRKDGIMRGTAVLTHLGDQPEELSVVKAKAAQHYSFNKGSSKQDYPISLMGSVALIRQTWLDAEWYAQQNDMLDFDLAAINTNNKLPKIITTANWQQTLLAEKIANEFGTKFVVKTSGDSYQNLAAVSATEQTLIVPLGQPKAPQINDELDAWNVSYRDLKKWEVAPFNPALLEQQGVSFALVPSSSPQGLDSFLKDLRTAHEHGLSEAGALQAITSVPAQILGRNDLGSLDEGHYANFVVTTAPLLHKDAMVAETWTAGIRHSIKGLPKMKSGHYQLTQGDKSYQFNLTTEKGKIKLAASDEEDEVKYNIKAAGNFATLTVTDEDDEQQFFGAIDNRAFVAVDADDWQMTRLGDVKVSDDDDADNDKAKTTPSSKELPSIPFPFNAYGLIEGDDNDSVLIKNATVWTNEDEGILTNTDVLVVNGKIKSIGSDLSAKQEQRVIDGTGMHLTSGIVDEHAHIALLSVNDIAVNSSMVRMKDAINPHDVNIYRNLAGGVTMAQLLHGSANPIGGQSALIKLKWGVEHPEDLLIDGAEGFIKFALGENVKRSRNQESIRYPLTRMGVEQVYRDAFTQAQAYEKAWKDYNKLSSRAKKKTTAPRKDLVMDATLEVINQERYVSCHSYVQSEINMLMHVAEDFGFNVNTFTHILEGYKVADKMKAHGVGASTFSDWWAFKWEVNYAIPYNAALMNNAGVVTAINSDSAEMSRRLNQEAAKSIKYGGLSEQEAWKLVTLNPAKLLRLDDRVGSIKVGKDADLVLWSDNPLSIYAKAEKTMVEGVVYYDREQQDEIEQTIAAERSRLIDLTKNSKGAKAPFQSKPMKTYECESITGHQHIDHLFFTGAVQ
ncbi:amidohydrolase family protein [Marinicella sp. S1101]|uniref:amidohydrolase family protein n=1 Tax=Marinicella marina TaxID=2996016 RepID=UPI002260CF0B|nr:amidohydrolase family protein [Marinicella marina]MCX7554717.1 amidohydrolase family protein [Marinicella marina]MDJ1141467.1 amidohydrolase family protein [Marinicella marina]